LGEDAVKFPDLTMVENLRVFQRSLIRLCRRGRNPVSNVLPPMFLHLTEGTPLSPVFAHAEELAQWLADHEIPLFGDLLATREQWLKIIEDSAESIPVFVKPAKMSCRIQ
jgi:hypothetical protein